MKKEMSGKEKYNRGADLDRIDLGNFPKMIAGHPVIAEKSEEELGFTDNIAWKRSPDGSAIYLPEPVLLGSNEFRTSFVFEEHGLAGLYFEMLPVNRFDRELAKKQDKIITKLLFEQVGRPDEDMGISWGFYTDFGVAVHFPYTGFGENSVEKAGSITIGAWETRMRDTLRMLEFLHSN